MRTIPNLIIALAISIYSSNTSFSAQEPKIRIISPSQGQYFAPGDKVSIEVEIPSSLHATDGEVNTMELGVLKAKDFKFQHLDGGVFVAYFRASLDIPDFYAGPIILQPSVYAGGPDIVVGTKLTINVRPKIAPKELTFANQDYFLSPNDKETQLYVTGKYENGLQRDLTSSVTGTAYLSNDPKVISVDREGLCRSVGKGIAVITVANGGTHGFVMFVVEDDQHPNPPIDMTNKVLMVQGSQRESLEGNMVKQTITMTNTSDLPLVGPLWLVVSDVPYGLRADDKVSVKIPDGLNLFPKQSASAELAFMRWRNVAVNYKIKLYHGIYTSLPSKK